MEINTYKDNNKNDEIIKVKKEIKKHINILEVAKHYLDLKKVGANYNTFSPFKPERTPSFFVSPSKNIFKCFATGIGGDAVKLVAALEGVSEEVAAKIIIDRYNLPISYDILEDEEYIKYVNIFKKAVDAYHYYKEETINYLHKRNLDSKFYFMYNLGYAPASNQYLVDKLKSAGESMEYLCEIGLLRKNNGKYYDYISNAIVIPLYEAGNPIAFYYRKISDENYKYISSKNTKYYSKSSYVYNIDRIEPRADYIIIVEGLFDLYSILQMGYKNTVSTLGALITKNQIEKIANISKNIILGFDNDAAGLTVTMRLIEKYGRMYNFYIIDYGNYKDANEMLSKSNENTLKVREWHEHLKYIADKSDFIDSIVIKEFINKNKRNVNNTGAVRKKIIYKHEDYFNEYARSIINDMVFIGIVLLLYAIEKNDYISAEKMKVFLLSKISENKSLNNIKNMLILYSNKDIISLISGDMYDSISDNLVESDRDVLDMLIFYYELYKENSGYSPDIHDKIIERDCLLRSEEIDSFFYDLQVALKAANL